MRYRFTDLNSLADHISSLATKRWDQALLLAPRSIKHLELQASAAAYEACAHVIRNSKLDK